MSTLKAGDRSRCPGPVRPLFRTRVGGRADALHGRRSGLSSPRSMILDLLEARLHAADHAGLRPAQPRRAVPTTTSSRRSRRSHAELQLRAGAVGRARGLRRLPRGLRPRSGEGALQWRLVGRKAYLCGPPPMIEACLAALMQGLLYERDIYTEKLNHRGRCEQAAQRVLQARLSHRIMLFDTVPGRCHGHADRRSFLSGRRKRPQGYAAGPQGHPGYCVNGGWRRAKSAVQSPAR